MFSYLNWSCVRGIAFFKYGESRSFKGMNKNLLIKP